MNWQQHWIYSKYGLKKGIDGQRYYYECCRSGHHKEKGKLMKNNKIIGQ